MSLHLEFVRLPDSVMGIYTNKEGRSNWMPPTLRQLAPDAAASYMRDLNEYVVVSDMRRSAESSLQAVQEKRGALMPGYSRHGFGVATDIHVDKTMENLGIKSKAKLDLWFLKRGWVCHRQDSKRGKEDYHMNYLPGRPVTGAFSSDEGEAEVKSRWGAAWDTISATETQQMLAKLVMYHGEIDGLIGPRSRAAIAAFSRAWMLKTDDWTSENFQRTIRFVTAEVSIVDWVA